MSRVIESTSLIRYLATHSTNTALTLGLGFQANPFTTSKRAIPFMGYNALRLWFFGTASNNQTFTYRVWQVWRLKDANGANPSGGTACLLEAVGNGTATLSGSLVGASATAGVLLTTDLVADTLTFTVASSASTPKSSYSDVGTVAAVSPTGDFNFVMSSPADTLAANLYLFDLQPCDDIIVEMALGTATGANCLYQCAAIR